jgi:hypothetical protein
MDYGSTTIMTVLTNLGSIRIGNDLVGSGADATWINGENSLLEASRSGHEHRYPDRLGDWEHRPLRCHR